MKITWAMVWSGPGTYNTTFNTKSIFYSIDKISRYFNVQFVQVQKNPQYLIVLSKKNGNDPRAAAWTERNTINIARSAYNFKQNLEIGGQALVHEWGHIFGGHSHAPQGPNIMSPALNNQYINFSRLDANWYNKLAWRSALRPWNEPQYWAPKKAESWFVMDQMQFGSCRTPIWNYYYRKFVDRPQILHIEE